ncbi:low-density lipoprotein receptor-related protein 6 isoform X2 [Cimex lectularius]|nr:low-density lipoprotein receptor-related protein 6 isoform X2 [Cimex lectularius]
MNVVASGLFLPEGLACDWLTQKLYWTDGETNRIEVITMDGKQRKVLFWDIDQPRAIVVVPNDSIMFWSDWGDVPKIERASMNGDPHSRKIIVSDDIYWPNGMTVDYDAKRVYWLDGKLRFIAVMDYDGRNRRKLIESDVPYPFSLTIYKEKMFWTDWETWSIHTFDINTSQTKELFHIASSAPFDVRVMDPSRQPPKITPCSVNNGGCSHLCLLSPYSPGYSCACPTGVKLIDNYTCANGPQEMILLVQVNEICLISLDSPDHTIISLNIVGIKHAIGIDYDPVNSYIYWTDNEAQVIRRAKLNGTESSDQMDIVSSELQSPDGVAVDWRAQNLYWTDSGTDRIQVLRLQTTFSKVLINSGLVEPRAIVVAPDEGLMFWSDWNEKNPKIERAGLDGSMRTLLVHDHLGWPNGIALDHPAKKLYWCDAKTDKIEVINYDGTDRKEIIMDNIPHVFGLSLLGDYLYWTDWQRRSLDSGHKITGANRRIILDLANMMGLKAIGKMMKPTKYNPCAQNNGNCSHLCLNTPTKYTCACHIGYELEANGFSCVVPKAFLLFAKKYNIGRISIENAQNDAIIPVSGIKDASALDFDIKDGRIYWTDVKANAIARSYINGSHVEKIVEFGLESPEGLAVDWLAQNVYWTDASMKRIEVAKLDGRFRKTIIWSGLIEPRSIAVEPKRKFIFWSDWGNSGSINRALLNGASPKVILANIGRANSLTIDYGEGRIYWCAIQGSIESAYLNGTERSTLVKSPRPFTMSIYQDNVYWSDWETGQLYVTNKHMGQNKTLLHPQAEQVTSVVVYHSWARLGWTNCTNGGGCAHLCLGSCTCQNHYTLSGDKCLPPSSFMLVATKNSVSRLVFESGVCPDSPLPIHGLKNVKSIDYDPIHNALYWLEGRSQTTIKRWSQGVSSVVVSGLYGTTSFAVDPFYRVLFFTCPNEGTINATKLDNGTSTTVVIRTHPSEKPKFIALHTLKGLLFWVGESRESRIYKSRMDGVRRVTLISNLPQVVSLAVDQKDSAIYWATGMHLESADFEGKNRVIIATGEKINWIAAMGKSVYWIHSTSVMNYDRHTNHAKIVFNSHNHLVALISMRVPSKKSLIQPNWKCWNGEILQSHIDCTREGPCSHDQFSCISSPGECIPMKWRCDSMADCFDGSDETNCPQCAPDKFTCQPSLCIDMKFVCDGTPHCPDNSDEKSCCITSGGHQCGSRCIPAQNICDGWSNCSDGSDESAEACATADRRRMAVVSDGHISQGPIVFIVFVIASLIALVGYSIFRWHSRKLKSGVAVVGPNDPALDPLSPKTRNGQVPVMGTKLHPGSGIVRMSSLQRSTSSQPSTGSLFCYPLNPPPSPATTNKERLTFYRPPPPTPCSTDVCHETDSNYQGESEPLPPPPTPTSASPSPSSSTYFHPTPPPPSPTV